MAFVAIPLFAVPKVPTNQENESNGANRRNSNRVTTWNGSRKQRDSNRAA
jgi:hypothetical protein